MAGSGASADNSPCSAADEPPVTFVSDGNRLEIRHLRFAASRSYARQQVFSSPKSPDAPEPYIDAAKLSGIPLYIGQVIVTRSLNTKYGDLSS